MRRALAPVPHPDEPRKRRPKPETRAAEARLMRFLRASFSELAGAPLTFKRRMELRDDAHREVNAYFDAKVHESAKISAEKTDAEPFDAKVGKR